MSRAGGSAESDRGLLSRNTGVPNGQGSTACAFGTATSSSSVMPSAVAMLRTVNTPGSFTFPLSIARTVPMETPASWAKRCWLHRR